MTALRTALAFVFALVGASAAAQPDALAFDEPLGGGPVFRVSVDGMIDNALARYIDRSLADATEADAALVVFEVDTFGGLLDAADAIRKSILDTAIPTIAVIDRNAASAGALIAYAADKMVFVPGASMGAATAVDQAGEYAPEKIQSYTRGLMRATAEANGRDPEIAEAMVDETIDLPGVAPEGELLTLSSDEALRLGVADAVLPSTEAVVEALGVAENVQEDHAATRAERVLRFLGSPVMASLLMLMMLGGLYFELQTPGVGFAGAMALVGAALFFAPHYLLGLAQSWEIALFVLGVILIAVEVFVTPGFGVFGISGLIAVVGALLIALVPNIGFEFPSDGAIAQATTTLAAALVLLALLAVSLARVLPKSERFGRLVLAPTLTAADGYTSADTVYDLVGKRGTAITGLRPSGTVEVEGARVDVVSEGPFVAPGADVEVVSAQGSRVVVREVA
ncbi:MAG: NfeD family protein [Bacteroidota bacterium]